LASIIQLPKIDYLMSIAEEMWRERKEPEWMLKIRKRGVEAFYSLPMPGFGPRIDVDFVNMEYYVPTPTVQSYDELPSDVKAELDALGIPEEEKKVLAGLSVQVDSSVIYKQMLEEIRALGVIVESMDDAVRNHSSLLEKYFHKLVDPAEHKFSALHAAFWSGGTFIYVPEGIEIPFPISTFFMMRARSLGQFEHTIIVAEPGAKLHYIEGCSAPVYSKQSVHAGVVEIYAMKESYVKFTTIQNWAGHIYNLPTKRAIAQEGARVDWTEAMLGSKATMVYPTTILAGKGAQTRNISLSFADKDHYLDVGAGAIHDAPHTRSSIISKSVAKDRGTANFRGRIKVTSRGFNAVGHMKCDTLILSKEAKSETIPRLLSEIDDVDLSHEAFVGRVSEEKLFYLMSRGLSREEALGMIVNGFFEPVLSDIPFEYSNELRKLVEMSIKGM
jgi:Fe-S cluster assembly protein SufB